MIRRATKPILCVCLMALALPGLAQASVRDVLLDCQDNGRLDRHHSRSELRKVQKNLPTDIDEYNDCREAIAAALAPGARRHRGGGSSGGNGGAASRHKRSSGSTSSATTARAREQAARAKDAAALDALTHSGKKPHLKVGGTEITPGDNGLFNLASAANGLPLPLLLALIATGLLGTGAALTVLRRRVPGLAGRLPLLSKLTLPRVRLPRLLRR